jgi:hypothetical protein
LGVATNAFLPIGGDVNRKNDTKVLLDAAFEQHKQIIAGYEAALRNKSLDLRVPVKNAMENLRSALDYMAHDIYEACCQPNRIANGLPNPKNIYFPYGRTKNDFKSGVGSSLPGLDTASLLVYELLLSIQPFTCGDNWLYELCCILNEKKHDRLTEQVRTETKTHTVQGPKGSVTIPVNNPNIKVVSKPGAVKIFEVPAEFHEDGIHTTPSPDLKHIRTTWVGFTFAGTDVNVLGLLNKAVVGVRQFSDSLNKLI